MVHILNKKNHWDAFTQKFQQNNEDYTKAVTLFDENQKLHILVTHDE